MDSRQSERIIKDFGEKLKKIRTEKSLSIRALADLADLNFGNLGDIELGKVNPTLTTIVILAQALNVDRADLLDF